MSDILSSKVVALGMVVGRDSGHMLGRLVCCDTVVSLCDWFVMAMR